MKTIKSLSVTASYTVQLFDVEVPDEVYKQLENNSEFTSNDINNDEANEWLSDNIKEDDACNWSFEVDDIIE